MYPIGLSFYTPKDALNLGTGIIRSVRVQATNALSFNENATNNENIDHHLPRRYCFEVVSARRHLRRLYFNYFNRVQFVVRDETASVSTSRR